MPSSINSCQWSIRVLYCHLQHHNDTINKQTSEDFFKSICTSHFIVRVRKGYSRFACERELETEQKLQYFDPTLMAVSVVSFSLDPNSSELQGPFGLMWLSLPHLVYNSIRSLTATGTNLTSVLTELYNSSTPTQSPTQSLKWHDWSSSSGNNCHAVHRSLSSGASVYECTMGIFFTSSHFISQFPPTRFPLITAIRMCHFLQVHHLGMAFLARLKAKIQQEELTRPMWYNHMWYHLWSGWLVTTPLDSQPPIN